MVESSQQTIIDNLARVRDRIYDAASRAGRPGGQITLVGVTKRKPVDLIQVALQAGLTDIGENRLQEARDKFPRLDLSGVKRHLIGHLQTNKVKYVPTLFDVVHSVDSNRVASALDHQMAIQRPGQRLPIFIQVNTSGEASKFGVEPETAADLADFCTMQKQLHLQGLMTIGPLTDDHAQILAAFRQLRHLGEQIQHAFRDRVDPLELSMGMTDDFEMAIAEGATHVRVGRAIFGERE